MCADPRSLAAGWVLYGGATVRVKLANPRFSVPSVAMLLTLAGASGAIAADPQGVVANPSFVPADGPVVVDFSESAAPEAAPKSAAYPPSASTFDELDNHILSEDPKPDASRTTHALPDGLTQVGGMVVPEEMLDGAAMVPDVQQVLASDNGPALGEPPEFCAFPDEVPAGIYDYDHRPGGETPRFHTVFLNYNGGVLATGGENASENLSNIARSGHLYPVYGGGKEKAIAVAQAVQADLADWAVRVVYLERPPKVLPYSMVMIGGSYSDTTAGPSGGVAPLDCEDFGQRNVCYAFQNASSATNTANVASQEIGHTLGLGHTTASDSVMAAGYASTQAGDLGFNDSCTSTIQVQGQGASCVGVNKCHCGTGDQQHDKNTLFATFAPAGPDITPPTIELLQPEDGAVFAPEDTIRLEFEPWDDVGGYGWKFMVTNIDTGEELANQVDYERALEFDLVGLPEGNYEIRALIQDHADQTDEDAVTISVATPGSDDGGSGGGSDDGSDGDDGEAGTGDDGGAGSGDGDDSTIDGQGADGGFAADDDSGCNCTTTPRPTAPWMVLGLLALLGIRRRHTV